MYTKLILQLEKLKIYVIPSDKWIMEYGEEIIEAKFIIWYHDKLSVQTNIWEKLIDKTYKMFSDLDITIN